MFLLSYAAFLSGAVVMVADAANGALTGSPGSLFLTFWAYGTAVCLAVTGIGAGLGTIAALATTLTLTIVGNASAGGPVPPPCSTPFSQPSIRSSRRVPALRRPAACSTSTATA